ncbi:4'-phosphopantetheinyl transferase superfamily protein [Patescibacteria group bacterium]|nr:4'-phosphopantetheinyl transferase superfamily protein [Patescibacteria group bacterium]
MVGIDIVSIKRFKSIKKTDYSFWDKFYTKEEWQYCFKKAKPTQHLAGIFASKEAVIKVYSKKEIDNHCQIEIKHKVSGQPFVKIKNLSKQEIQISISYDHGFAIAIAFRK